MFYVYVYRDPRPTKDRQPVYVGKGCGNRANAHWLRGNKVNRIFDAWLRAIRKAGLEPIIEIIAEFAVEAEAFDKERELIALFGRKDLKQGPLCNCTNGGEGFAGLVVTDEHRARMSAAAKVRPSEAYRSDAFVRKMSEDSKRKWATAEYRAKTCAAMVAAANTEAQLVRKSEATAAGWANAETRRRRIDGIKASRTPELRAQIGAACAALWTDAKRAEQSEKMKKVLEDPKMRTQRAAQLKANPITPPKPVAARSPDGEVREFPSSLAVMQETGIADGILRKVLRGGIVKRGKFKGWGFTYLPPTKNPYTLSAP
jgi:hypothetical protein